MGTLTDMATAIDTAVDDGDGVYLAGFTHLIPFAAGHEMIRQGLSDLHLMRATPDLVYDQMIAAGCASAVTFSWAGNPGVGSLRAFRRAVEEGVPDDVEIDEYSHFGLVTRLNAGASDLPFLPLRTFAGSDLPDHSENVRRVEDPFGDEEVYAVPPLNPDVAVVRAQRADASGNAHVWGILGEVVEAAFAADRVILCAEEVVGEDVIRSDPNRTEIPGTIVDHAVHGPPGQGVDLFVERVPDAREDDAESLIPGPIRHVLDELDRPGLVVQQEEHIDRVEDDPAVCRRHRFGPFDV
jgi:glutaconate CoA-transferase subunit A